MAENQNVVEAQVHHHGGDARQHGKKGVAALFQRAGVGVGNGEGQKAPEHDGQVFQSIVQCPRCRGGIALAGEIQPNQRAPFQGKNRTAQQGEQQADQKLEPEGVAHALGVGRAVELSSKNSGAGAGTENAQVKDKNQAIDDGHAAHGNGAHLTDHDVVKQGNKVRDAVLNDNGHGNPKNTAVKRLAADVTLEHRILL